MHTKALLAVFVLFSLLVSCNMPVGQTPGTQAPEPENEPVSSNLDANAIGTAVELTAAAKFTEIAGSVTATPTTNPTPTFTLTSAAPVACNPLVTANVNANVRSGPDTAYDVVGALTLGQTATIVGRNDAYTWWYIAYPGISGGHAWVAGSVVTSACVPAVVQVVAAPPLPTATIVEVADNPSDDSSSGQNNNLLPLLPLKPLPFKLFSVDLSPVAMTVQDTVIKGVSTDVQVKIKNKGSTDAGAFTVQWWAGPEVGCSWPVDALAAGASKILNCSYAFPNLGDTTIQLVVDSGGSVTETDETNNATQQSVKVMKISIPDLKLPQPILPKP